MQIDTALVPLQDVGLIEAIRSRVVSVKPPVVSLDRQAIFFADAT